jgi:beta-galactosidase
VSIWFGGDYSPEQWDAATWARDDALMRQAQVNTVTVGVFSWALLEPADGSFSFDWLDATLDRLHGNGVRVVLATPTASPPPWFTLAHPDAMPVRPDGSRLWHGSRDTYCAAAPAYREAALRITSELGRRYASHPALALWHVHNEYGTMCWCDQTAAAFRKWLRVRYESLDGLNDAWGTAFWSQRYTSWEQVLPPRETQYLPNPGQTLDFRRFWSDELLARYLEQRDALRSFRPDVPVTTNFMGPDHLVIDPRSWGKEVDVVAVDHYLSSAARLDGAADIAFVSDWARGIGDGRPWLLMEQAPSTVIDSGVLTHRSPGRMISDSLQYVARGSDGALFFQWRASRAGAEMYHPALVPHAGADSRIFAEATALGATLSRLSEVAGSVMVPAPVAVMVDAPSHWALQARGLPSPHVRHLDVARALHGSLWRSGVGCDVVAPDTDLSSYRLVLVPAVYLLSDAAATALRAYVALGGKLVVTFCSGIADETHRIWLDGYPGALRDVLGIRIEEFHPLQPAESVALCEGASADSTWDGRLWAERLRPEGATVLASYASGDLAGLPAVTRHSFGAGTAWYLSTLPSDDALTTLLGPIARAAGCVPLEPPGVCVTLRRAEDGQSWRFAFNHGEAPALVPASGAGLISEGTVAGGVLCLPPGGYAVIREGPSPDHPEEER